ncbi:GNAT family N-acetyltransferase [Microbulbifer pacificus]|uniref:GNAT family N-acetyltransferase n=1 Tax=Microbulbifer pacificus TaxID=407164 RepID=UPI000CF393A0|nr:GNAT family N-acetyltransferase [Microbulbifer pacificus]
MQIEYKTNVTISTDQFIDLLKRSTLGERRPVDDRACMEGMLKNANLTVSAWIGGELAGIARSVTDFTYACYLSDLAVSGEHQKTGIGRQLLTITQENLGPRCKLILLAAPAANAYYEHLGFSSHPRCWILERDETIQTQDNSPAR